MNRRHRLGSSRAIRTVQSRGRRVRGTAFSLGFVQVEPASQPPRFAVVASRRVGNAVERNRARRRLRGAIDVCVDGVKPGVDCVVAATGATNTLDFQILVDTFTGALRKAGLLAEAATAVLA